MRPARRRRHASIDLIGFLDILSAVMVIVLLVISVLALSLGVDRGRTARGDPRSKPTAKPAAAAAKPIADPWMKVPTAASSPLVALNSADGLRPLGLGGEGLLQRYFFVTAEQGQLVLDPRPASVMSAGAFRDWIRTYSTSRHHIVAVVSPDGAERYREVREAARAAGFRSGWLEHLGGPLRVGEGGRKGESVQ
ncbi:MAG: hypothetical protein DCF18_10835 [Cyanobium sp.]|jgi:hypothetical protein|uniref:hypothetical protein n=1 Tax=Synechococcus sp. CS-1333 TaxID=2848638 RepID=UPI000DBBBC7B|nr:hypothetical protein [Synechococcus sp. CS-1333]MCT0210769.1 hypothetical protein [Synechococcus sp. CS-1333]PZV21929.1 MAG: hypothetical protein DCF18_10835 [Cyanobium sp.]